MKKILSMLLILAIVCTMFTACAKTAETEAPAAKEETPAEETKQDVNETTETDGTEEAEEVSFDKLDITMFSGGYGELWDEMVALFKEKYPNVEVISDCSNDVETRIRSRMMTDTPPDVMFVNSSTEYDVYQAAASGMLMDLSDFFANGVNADGDPMSEVINDSRLENGTINGGVYLPTWSASYGGWFYNAALFEKNGWAVPTTLEDVIELAPKMIEAGMEPLMYQANKAAAWGIYYQAIAAAGGYDHYQDCFVHLTEGAWDSAETLEAITNVESLIKSGALSKASVGADYNQAQLDFVNDRIGLITCGSWFENEMGENIPDGFEMSFIPFPAADEEGNRYICAFGATICIPAGAVNPDAAKAFLGVVYSKEGQKLIAKYGGLPVTENVSFDEIADFVAPSIRSVIESTTAEKIKFVSNDPQFWYAAMWPTFCDCIDNLTLGDITPEEFCQAMEAAAAELRADDSIPKY